MRRYTTPTKVIRVEGVDLTDYDVSVSLRQTVGRSQNLHAVDLDMDDLTVEADGDDTLVTITLTQEQTGGFIDGPVEYQVNYGVNDARMATSIGSFPMERNLKTDVIEFAAGSGSEPEDEEAVVTIGTMPPKGSITSEYLAEGAVGSDQMATGAVTLAKLAAEVTDEIAAKVDESSVAVLNASDIDALFE